MNHLIKITDVRHISSNGDVLWHAQNLLNTFHDDGQILIFKVMFTGELSVTPDTVYYFGLDNRITISPTDTLASLVNEPNISTGYQRQIVAIGTSGFSITTSTYGDVMIQGPVITFQNSVVGSQPYPAANLFMTDGTYLIATVPLSSPTTLSYGDLIQVSMGLALRDVSPAS